MSYYYKTEKDTYLEDREDEISRIKTDRWILMLLVLAISFVPMLVGGHVRNIISPNITNLDLLSGGFKGDIFTYYKLIALLIITTIAVLLLLSKLVFMNGSLRRTKLNVFAGMFTVAIILSTILSPSASIALWGQYERSDGAISYICYLALFFVAINISYPQKAIQYAMYALYPFLILNLVLTTMNFYGYDALTYTPVQKLMSLFLPDGATLSEGSNLLGTLNQWNYMSGMFAVMTIMYLALSIVDTNKIRSLVNVGAAVVSFSIMLMSVSTSGFVTFFVIVPILIILIVKSVNSRKALIATVVFFILCVPIFHILAQKNPQVWDESIGFVIKKNPYLKEEPVAINGPGYEFSLGNKAYAAENNFELPVLPERGVSAGTGRMYIWQKTFELTKERPLFGYGLDTLMYHFPHYNIDARAGMWDENTIVDKPHSMYVGIFYGTGIVGLIGFAGLVILTCITSMKVIFARRQAMVAVFAVGWLAFLFQALFNDSLPGTAGPMWTVAGIMIGMILAGNNDTEKKPV